jgi:hypothetical protein
MRLCLYFIRIFLMYNLWIDNTFVWLKNSADVHVGGRK